ncbi:MAG: hypothetical protein R6U94_10600 [Nitriliruptoraceae bacterium]
MKVHVDIDVAVLSARTDLDLAISTWLPGYAAQSTEDPDIAMDVARRGGILLIDLGSPRHEEWVAALKDRGFDGPMVFLDPQGEMTIDLTDRVVVPSPPSLSGLLAGFEEAQFPGDGPRHRSGSEPGPRTPGRRRRRRSAAPATTSRSDRPDGGDDAGGTGRAGRLDRRRAVEEQGGVRGEPVARGRRSDRRSDRRGGSGEQVVPRALRSDQRDVPEELEVPRSVPRARRSDRRDRSWALLGSTRRRSSSASGEDPSTGEAGTQRAGAPARIGAEAERAFQEVFHDAETQPGAQHRVATPEGRVRVQTDEELFAEHSAAAPAEVEPGTVLTPAPARER